MAKTVQSGEEYFAQLKERGEAVKVPGGTLYHGAIFVADEERRHTRATWLTPQKEAEQNSSGC